MLPRYGLAGYRAAARDDSRIYYTHPQPDAEFYKTLSKALDEIAAGLELLSKAD